MVVTFGRTHRGAHPPSSPDPTDGYQELDCRESGGLRVRLLWDRPQNQVFVHVLGDGLELWLNPPSQGARYAFHHPFAVAHLCEVAPAEPGDQPVAA